MPVGYCALELSRLRINVTRLFLAADGEHKHRVKFRHISVQRNIAAGTLSDHELPQVRSDRSTDQRIAFQHIDCTQDVVNARGRLLHLMLQQMFQDAIEIIADLRCELDARHS